MTTFKNYLIGLSTVLVGTVSADIAGRVLENSNTGSVPSISLESVLSGVQVQLVGKTNSTLTNTDGEFSLSVGEVTAINLQSKEVNINLQNGQLSIQTTGESPLSIQLFSVLGDEVASYYKRASSNKHTVNLFENQSFKEGVFILKIQSDEGTYIQKIGVLQGQAWGIPSSKSTKISSFKKTTASSGKNLQFSLTGFKNKTVAISSDTLDLGDVLLTRAMNRADLEYSDYYKMKAQENYLNVDFFDSLKSYSLLLEGIDTQDSFVFDIDSVTTVLDSSGNHDYRYWWSNSSSLDLKSDVYGAALQVKNDTTSNWDVKKQGTDSTVAQIVYPEGSDYFDVIKSMGNFHPGLNAWLVWSRNNLDVDLLEGVSDYSGALHFYTVTGSVSLGSVPARSAFGNGVDFGTIRCSPPTFLPKKGHYRARYIGRNGEKTPFVNIYFQNN